MVAEWQDVVLFLMTLVLCAQVMLLERRIHRLEGDRNIHRFILFSLIEHLEAPIAVP